ncbi:MAG: Ig-like domain-containing protein, partial [Bacteroidota bacterium]
MLQYREADGNVFVATFGRGVFSTDAFSDSKDVTPPSVVSFDPEDGSSELLSDINLEISFNEPIVLGTGNISVLRSSDDSVFEALDASSSGLSVSGARLIINPSSDLEFNTSYYINIESGVIQDSNGNSFTGISDKETWNFETFDGDFPPVVAQSLGTVRIIRGEGIVTLDVDLLGIGVFTDPDNDDSAITYEIVSNSDETFIGTSISGNILTLSALVPNEIGSASLVLQANSNGKTVTDEFSVVVRDESLYSQVDNLDGEFIISMQMTDRSDTLVQLADD